MTELWRTISPFLREIILLLGVAIATYSVLSARDIAKKKESLAMLMVNRKDEELSAAIHKCAQLHAHYDKDIAKLACAVEGMDDATRKDRKEIIYLLNHFEYVSVGIHKNIYSEPLLKSSQYTTVTTVWKNVEPFVREVRRQKDVPTIYQEFQELAEKWIKNPLERKTTPWWRFWRGS